MRIPANNWLTLRYLELFKMESNLERFEQVLFSFLLGLNTDTEVSLPVLSDQPRGLLARPWESHAVS
jgi:hypothetical protein